MSDGTVGFSATTLGQARRAVAERLRNAGRPDPEGDARHLVAIACDLDPARLAVEASRQLSPSEGKRLADAAAQRVEGRTVGRIRGHRPFHDIVLNVTDDVLEPRDDTAALVELALPLLRTACERETSSPSMWDVGVGSGTVLLALLAAEPRARGQGTDTSERAIALTTRNTERLGLRSRVTLKLASMLDDGTAGRHDLIVSNPPYIPSREVDTLDPDTRGDPRDALDGGADGLDFYRRFAVEAAARLRPGGAFAAEIGAGQSADVRRIFADHGWAEIGAMRDLSEHERAIAFRPGRETGG